MINSTVKFKRIAEINPKFILIKQVGASYYLNNILY
jgi:hypothetical protein